MRRRVYVIDDTGGFTSADTLSLFIEMLFGLFGWSGVGWLYAGNVGAGIGIMIGFWMFLAIEATLTIVTGGCLACFVVPLHLTLIVVSAIKAREYSRRVNAKGNIGYVLSILFVILLLMMCGLIGFCSIGTGLISSIPAPDTWPTLEPFIYQ